MADIRIHMPDVSKAGRIQLTHDDPVEPTNSSADHSAGSSHHATWIALLKKAMAELISTFILVFAGCGAIMVDALWGGVVTHVGIALTFGLVIAAMIYTVGHISGAHMNPAVTIASALTKHFPWRQVPMYVAAQCAGAIAASFALNFILYPGAAFGGATLPSVSGLQSLMMEVIITFILMFVISAVTTDKQSHGKFAGIAVGSTIALNVLMAKPISGASMNPARSLGPAIASSNYEALWVYIVGPILGAAAGALSYSLIRLPETASACDQKPANNTQGHQISPVADNSAVQQSSSEGRSHTTAGGGFTTTSNMAFCF